MKYYENNTYASWLQHANERSVLEKVLDERSKEWITSPHTSMIEIGCGSGAAAQRFMKLLEEKGISYDYIGVEPYKAMRDAFPVNEHALVLPGDYQSFQPDRKYDLSIAVHSLYYAPDMAVAIEKLTDSADKTIIVHHGQRGINTVQQEFRDYVHPGNNIVSTAEDIETRIKNLDRDYDFTVYPTQVDLRPCQDPDNVHGRNIILFFLERDEISLQKENEVRRFLKIQGEYMTHDMGLFIIK